MNNRLPLLLTLLAGLCSAQNEPSPQARDTRVARIHKIDDLRVERGGADVRLKLTPERSKPDPLPIAHPVARLLRALIEPPLAANEKIVPLGERWVAALARPEQQEWIKTFLTRARGLQNSGHHRTVSILQLRMPETVYQRDVRAALVRKPTHIEAGADEAKDAEARGQQTVVLEAGSGTEAFMNALLKHDGVETLGGPMLALDPLVVGQLSSTRQITYVREFDIELASAATIANPVVDVVEDGTRLYSVLFPLADDRLFLMVEVHVTELEQPIPQRSFTIPGTTHEVTVQLPHLVSTRVEAAVEIQPGDTVILVPQPVMGQRMMFVVEVGSPNTEPKPKERRKNY